MMNWFGGGSYGMGNGFGWIFMILFLGILINLVVQGVNRWSLNGPRRSQLKTAPRKTT